MIRSIKLDCTVKLYSQVYLPCSERNACETRRVPVKVGFLAQTRAQGEERVQRSERVTVRAHVSLSKKN